MPHDAHGLELKVGDMVNIPATIESIQRSEDYCNVTVELKYLMPKYAEKTSLSCLNTRQLEKVREVK